MVDFKDKDLLKSMFSKTFLKEKFVDQTSENSYIATENILCWDIETAESFDDQHTRAFAVFNEGVPMYCVETYPLIDGKLIMTKEPSNRVMIPQGILIQMLDKGFEVVK
tara:strand:- start:2730 stop:3056 length:327 start_codon:yes stop_codon:yes gene_type:complete